MYGLRGHLVVLIACSIWSIGSFAAEADTALGPDTIFEDGFETGDVSGWTLAFDSCGDDLANGTEQCDGTDLGGLTCAALGFSGGGNPQCTTCCTAATITCVGDHAIGYERIAQTLHTGDLVKVKWHRSGRFALILTDSGAVLRYDADTGQVSVATDLGATALPADIDASWNGQRFLIVGSDLGVGKIWPVAVAPGDVLSFPPPITVSSGTPVAVAAQPRGGREWTIAIRTDVFVTNVIGLWNGVDGLHTEVGYTAGAWVSDLMWRQTTLFGVANDVILSHGLQGADSKTFEVDTGMVVANGWPPWGNAGSAEWRGCAGTYGMFAGISSNRVYVYDGSWFDTILPGLPLTVWSVGWRPDGTRALVVGRVGGTPLRASVRDHQAGMTVTYDDTTWFDAAIPDFHLDPWFGNNTQWLFDVDWQPQSDCDGGLIVGTNDGASGDGLLIRFFDTGDADCLP